MPLTLVRSAPDRLSAQAPERSWDAIGGSSRPSWYLDPVVADQKRTIHRELVRRWTRGFQPRSVLKTDLFEEAFGRDSVLFDLVPGARQVVGIDVARATVEEARRRSHGGASLLVADVRTLGLRSESFDLVFSNSTLDHFDSQAELRSSLRELVRVVSPGGRLIITLDNPCNPLYPALRWLSRRGGSPFPLGKTARVSQLEKWLSEAGLEVTARDWLIHNPRLLSTALFLGLRRLFGARADAPIRGLLRIWAAGGKLPSKRFTSCFVAVCARKPDALPSKQQPVRHA